MIFKLTGISVILFFTTLVNFFTTYLSWQRRKTKGGLYFTLGMLAVTIWTLAAGFDYALIPIPDKIFFAKWEYTAYNSALALFVLFSLTYAGFENFLKKSWVIALIFLIPISNILLAWTNEFHGWLWSGFTRISIENNIVNFEHGPGYVWVSITGYAMVMIMIVSLWQASRSGSELSKRQARWLFYAILFPLATNLIYRWDITNTPGVDWSSITFSISGLFILIALYGTRLLDISPIARHKMIEQMSDGVLVLDEFDRVSDFNPAMKAIFGINQDELGNPIHNVLVRWPEIVEFSSSRLTNIIQEIATVDGVRVFNIQLTRLEEQHGRMDGKLIVFRDITESKLMELALRQSEEKFRQLITWAPDAIFGMDRDGKILFTNMAATNLLGYAANEMVDCDVEMLIPLGLRSRSDVQSGFDHNLPQMRIIGKGLELFARHKNGSEIPVDITLSNLETETGATMIAFLRDMTERKKADQQLYQAQAQLMEQQRELAKVEERQRIARDLHDSFNQSIHSLVLFSETLAANLEKNNIERALQNLGRLQESARQSLKETRLLLYQLQDPGLESMDLIQKLETRLAMVESRAGIRTELIQEGSLDDCPQEWQNNLFWIVTEALNNALKHAQARRVQVLIRSSEERIELEVHDNGKGFDSSKVGIGGLGLDNMRIRAEQMGGRLSVESELAQGTSVRFCAERQNL